MNLGKVALIIELEELEARMSSTELVWVLPNKQLITEWLQEVRSLIEQEAWDHACVYLGQAKRAIRRAT